MSERARALVREFYRALSARDAEAVSALYTDDATIEVLQEGPYRGGRPASLEGLTEFFGIFPKLEFSIDAITAEGDRVAVEVRSKGQLADGSPYGNCYHNLFVLRDGKIALLREYPTGVSPD